ncbi:MAG: L,D-transpeptidase family protein [Deltaproteobacteria bacterium]|jgi:murein L,D-transpeptidase YafK|nr:L,D-transpeptidase family protein [Deltaproteobacteria bacterium]
MKAFRPKDAGRAKKASRYLGLAAFSLAMAAVLLMALWGLPSPLRAQDEPHIDDKSGELVSEAPYSILYPGEAPGFILVVFKAIQQLHIYRHDGEGNLFLVRILPCSTGMAHGDKLIRGDKKTPEGYYIFRQKLLPTELPDIYGILAYPMDYPNFWDRAIGRGGDGIWTHGINKPLVDYDSEGCIELLNHDLAELEPYLRLFDTPILVEEDLRLQDASALKAEGRKVLDFVESWRLAWTGKDLASYGRMYDQGFVNSDALSFAAWMDKKRRLAQVYQRIEVSLDNIRAYRHRDTIMVSFNQIYKGDSRFTSKGLKRLYLREDPELGYQIVAEEFSPAPGAQPNKWLTASQREWALTTPPLAVAQVASPAAAASAGVLMAPDTSAPVLVARNSEEAEAAAAAEETARAAIESRSQTSPQPSLASLAPQVNPELLDDDELAASSQAAPPANQTQAVAARSPASQGQGAGGQTAAGAGQLLAGASQETEASPAESQASAQAASAGELSEAAAPGKIAPASQNRQAEKIEPELFANLSRNLAEESQAARTVTVSSGQPSGAVVDIETVATVASLSSRAAASSSDASPASSSSRAASEPGAEAAPSSSAADSSLGEEAASPGEPPLPDAKSAVALLEKWARSWSEKDREAYFALYDPDFFFPDQSLRLPAFKRYRGGHMARASFVKIALSDIDVTLKGSKAVVTFTQTYESDRNKDQGVKTLELTARDGRWMITSETFKPQS